MKKEEDQKAEIELVPEFEEFFKTFKSTESEIRLLRKTVYDPEWKVSFEKKLTFLQGCLVPREEQHNNDKFISYSAAQNLLREIPPKLDSDR